MQFNSEVIPNMPDWLDTAFEDEGPKGSVRSARFKVHRDIRLEGDTLVYEGTLPGAFELRRPPAAGRDSLRLLRQFLRLGRAEILGRTVSPQVILDMSQEWGPLGFCEHGQAGDCGECGTRVTRLFMGGAEPIGSWREWAACAVAVLSLNDALSALDGSGPPAAPTFDLLVAWIERTVGIAGISPPKWHLGRFAVAAYVNRWLQLAGIGLEVVAEEGDQLRMEIRADLFGWLGLQLAAAVAGSPGVAICTACALPYFPTRAPTLARDNYCDSPPCKREAKNSSYRAGGKTRQRTKGNRKGESNGQAS